MDQYFTKMYGPVLSYVLGLQIPSQVVQRVRKLDWKRVYTRQQASSSNSLLNVSFIFPYFCQQHQMHLNLLLPRCAE